MPCAACALVSLPSCVVLAAAKRACSCCMARSMRCEPAMGCGVVCAMAAVLPRETAIDRTRIERAFFMGFSREWWVRLPSVAGAWRLPFDDDPTDGRPKLIGRHRKKDDKWTTNNVAVCHMYGSRMKHLP